MAAAEPAPPTAEAVTEALKALVEVVAQAAVQEFLDENKPSNDGVSCAPS